MRYYEVEFSISSGGNAMQDTRDLLAAMTGDAGFEVFEDTTDGIKGYVQTTLFDREAIDSIIHDFPISGVKITYNVKDAEYKDWNEQWEQEGFEPIIVNNSCCIHDGRHLPDHKFNIMVEIGAKLAFGTGTHETTRMGVATILETGMTNKSILDCGCGTGILAIVALKAGAIHAVGYDIDEWSVENSLCNARNNGVSERFKVLHGDVSVLDTLHCKFDIVTANINRNILLADMSRFQKVMNTGANLILSGFYTDDSQAIIQRATELGLNLVGYKEDNGWACLKFINNKASE